MPLGSPNPDQKMSFSTPVLDQAPVVQTLDSAIHRINHYPVDKYLGNQWRYRLRVVPHFSSGIVERAKREGA